MLELPAAFLTGTMTLVRRLNASRGGPMTEFISALADLPTAALAALATLFVVQLTLQIFCLVDLSRRARVPGGRKWVWVLVVVFGQLLGAIVYLAAGRSVPPDVDTASDGAGAAARRAVDSLYGDRRD